jgi:hypothetical protein
MTSAIAIAALLVSAPPLWAAPVAGTLTGYESSTPLGNRYLHFENVATHDIYMTPTGPGGSFSVDLPPGVYDLRTERGAILARRIVVDPRASTIGAISDLAPLSPVRLCELQAIAPAQVYSPAPATANLMTFDPTAPPSVARPPAATMPGALPNYGCLQSSCKALLPQ